MEGRHRFCVGRLSEINGNDVIVSLGFFTDHAVPIPDELWAGVFMHELGHNFGSNTADRTATTINRTT